MLSILTACGGPNAQAEFSDTQNEPVNIANSDKWTLIAYWAEWCNVCVSEVPVLNELHNQESIQVVGVYFSDAPSDNLQKLAQKIGMNYPVVTSDPKNSYHWPELTGLPTHYLISPNNEVMGPFIGPLDIPGLLSLTGQGPSNHA